MKKWWQVVLIWNFLALVLAIIAPWSWKYWLALSCFFLMLIHLYINKKRASSR
jgi:hypothetical protein